MNEPPSPTAHNPFGATGTPQPLASFMAEDYMSLIVKQGLKEALGEYRSTSIQLDGPKSLADLAAGYPPNALAPTGVSRTFQIGEANQQLPLAPGATVQIADVKYTFEKNDTLNQVAGRFGVTGPAIVSSTTNPEISFSPLENKTPIYYRNPQGITATTVSNRDSFQSIAAQHGITGSAIDPDLIWLNLGVIEQQLLGPGRTVEIPPFAYRADGQDTLLSLAAGFNLTLNTLLEGQGPTGVNPNTVAPLFAQGATVSIPL
ncbi:MAG: hypothetical protein AAF492_17950, partial [Verrucomicrobiota bacterium]